MIRVLSAPSIQSYMRAYICQHRNDSDLIVTIDTLIWLLRRVLVVTERIVFFWGVALISIILGRIQNNITDKLFFP